ncbi:MAG: DUF2314 domain-containing protein [Henriciella sp.]|nr:DUF2314 domain-containing protein [Henriciella sp.]
MAQSSKRPTLWAAALIGLCLSVSACDRFGLSQAEPDISNTVEADPTESGMQLAVSEAQTTLPHFFRQMELPDAGQRSFTVKVGLPTEDGSLEYVWVSDLSRNEATITGRLSNEPFNLRGDLKMGDPVSFSEAEVTDWGYLEDEKLRGHFTTRHLASKMSDEEAAEVLAMMHDTPLPRAPLRPRFAG